MDLKSLFARVLHAQLKHVTFLDSTQRNLSYFLFGKNIDLVKRYTMPRIDILSVINTINPQPDNPLQSIVGAFTDELAVSEFRTTVRPYPVQGKEPYASYGDMLESYLIRIHELSKRRLYMRAITFELLCHGYFGIYFDGCKYWFLTAYDLIPGDPNIHDPQLQPILIRKTHVNKATLLAAGVDASNEQVENLGTIPEWKEHDDLEMFTLYDTYVKSQDLNVGFTEKGTVVYQQPLRYPKRYPIAIANTSELLSSFYTVPIMSQLVQKLIEYQKSNASIKDSSSSIAKPILTYDSDAGIDVDALHRALKMGYKHIIVGKNKEGDINFKAPGSLPQYAQELPGKIEEDIMKALGLNKTFMGLPNVGARERGALARLLKTSFRKLASISSIIEEAFIDMDSYILDYLDTHRITTQKNTGLELEQIFGGPTRYVPKERFVAYSSEDSLEKKSFILNLWKSKLIPTENALEELGETQPRKVIDKMKDEVRSNQEFTLEMGKMAAERQSSSTLDDMIHRLNGKLKNQYWINPIDSEKFLVRCHASEVRLVAFLLSDFASKVKIESYNEEKPAPLNQASQIMGTPSE